MFHVYSLQELVKKCQFNKYHNDLVEELETKLSEFTSCQSMVVLGLTSVPPITIDVFTARLTSFQVAIDSLNLGYKQVRLHRIEEVFQLGVKTQSEDHLTHAFFFFQLNAIAQLLIQTAATNTTVVISKVGKRKSYMEFFQYKFDWSKLLSAGKSMLIVGVGSIFVMIPRLANTFANGQWILIALCMTQGDTVGGAFNTMKMRLVGTLLGRNEQFCLSANIHSFLLCIRCHVELRDLSSCRGRYLQNIWHACTMAFSIRLSETVVWVGLYSYSGCFNANFGEFRSTVCNWSANGELCSSSHSTKYYWNWSGHCSYYVGFSNIRCRFTKNKHSRWVCHLLSINPMKSFSDTLKVCGHASESLHSVYDQFFHHQHSGRLLIEDHDDEEKSDFHIQRSRFHQLIGAQRILVNHAIHEPSLWWFNYGFSSTRYRILVQQQLDVFRMLHNINATASKIDSFIHSFIHSFV